MSASPAIQRSVKVHRRILVDMTPLGPNGQNGGAGPVAVTLVRHLSTLAPEYDFNLLTSQASHAELDTLDAANVRRTCVVSPTGSPATVVRRVFSRLLPSEARARLAQAYWSVRTSERYTRATDDIRPDLLFCPFTIPYFWRPGVPCISIVHDLQHLRYPEFFTSEQRLNRQRQLADASQKSDRLVCVSDYVRDTVLANLQVSADHVLTIPHGLLYDVANPDVSVVERLGLEANGFLLYPANFWPHKNHLVLIEALRIYRQRKPDSRLRLVCTGAPNGLMERLKSLAEARLPGGTVVFAGYVRHEELGGLLGASKAVVFPSLYEGFGMPVLEAMASGKPVLCSNVTSLPEVAGLAAPYFDPTQPEQIASAIDALQRDPAVIAERVALGRQRAAAFGTGRDMAQRHLALFRQLLSDVSCTPHVL